MDDVVAFAPDHGSLDDTIARAIRALLAQQREDGHFIFELEADATIPAEYVLLVHYLGEFADSELEEKIGNYLRRVQGDHGGWPLYHGGAFDLSATVKAYFALKMIGDSPEAPHMRRAREAVLARGGAIRANVFTRILLALFGEMPWRTIPAIPAELILAPPWFPIRLSKMSYWARTVLVPILVLAALKPMAKNPRGVHVAELFVPNAAPAHWRAPHQSRFWAVVFHLLDGLLKLVEPLWPGVLRRRALACCEQFVTERLNGEDGLGAIYPAMANSVMMYDALGRPPDHPHRALARHSIDRLLVIRSDEAYCQPCVSPVWDSALAGHALLEADAKSEAIGRLCEWLKARQVLDVKGDWAEVRPHVRPGGWPFQYNNAHYPDLDDTAAVVLVLDRAAKSVSSDNGHAEAIARGREWVEGLQSHNGGWASFDADNTYHYLNNIPFADHGALLDPPTADVTARCIGMLAQLGESLDSPRMKPAVDYLQEIQEKDGSWFGRWGVNYIYGTWSALAGLNAAGLDFDSPSMRRAADWLLSIQNPDGGWGESCDSYRLDYKGYEPAPSVPSQTAWALLGLMAAGEVNCAAVARGIRWLQETQQDQGLWSEESYTGGGFPRVFYLRYHGYAKFFPLWAVARYRNLRAGHSNRVSYGI
ncbi:MAG TPA: squalene--hopene cyclase [Rhizomicrobium sp.]|jgi:squalene-hopene/tetraprenyl-beta-curcumene cyclase